MPKHADRGYSSWVPSDIRAGMLLNVKLLREENIFYQTGAGSAFGCVTILSLALDGTEFPARNRLRVQLLDENSRQCSILVFRGFMIKRFLDVLRRSNVCDDLEQ